MCGVGDQNLQQRDHVTSRWSQAANNTAPTIHKFLNPSLAWPPHRAPKYPNTFLAFCPSSKPSWGYQFTLHFMAGVEISKNKCRMWNREPKHRSPFFVSQTLLRFASFANILSLLIVYINSKCNMLYWCVCCLFLWISSFPFWFISLYF